MRDALQVAGEDIDDLIRLFPYIRTAKQPNGLFTFSAERVPNEVLAPFWRALLRTEARLLKQDADQIRDDAHEPRTPDQRRADAFVDLIVNIGSASRYLDRGNRDN